MYFVRARCGRTGKSYFIAFVQDKYGSFAATETFPATETSLINISTPRNFRTGSFKHYVGCPFCKSLGVVKCGQCQEITCEGAVRKRLWSYLWQCLWCYHNGKLTGNTFNSLRGESDAKKPKLVGGG